MFIIIFSVAKTFLCFAILYKKVTDVNYNAKQISTMDKRFSSRKSIKAMHTLHIIDSVLNKKSTM